MIEGRILKGVGGLYLVKTGQGLYQCRARGVFRKKNITPTVGDWVVLQTIDEKNKEGFLYDIKERESLLLRPRIANVNQTLILFSNQSPALNPDLLDRLILLVEEAGIPICIGINKLDLGGSVQFDMTREIYERVGYKVFGFIAREGAGIEELLPYLRGRIYVLAGPSGVGKSSLVNRLYPEAFMETGELSRKIDRGRHTTRHAELIEFEADSFIADTPGFTSLSLDHIKRQALAGYFREMKEFLGDCRFTDCRHIDEPGCAVKEQVGQAIHPTRYERYMEIYKQLKE